MSKREGAKFRTAHAFGKKKRSNKRARKSHQISTEPALDFRSTKDAAALAEPRVSRPVVEVDDPLQIKRKLGVFSKKRKLDVEEDPEEADPGHPSSVEPTEGAHQQDRLMLMIVDFSCLDQLVSTLRCQKCKKKVSEARG